MVDTVIVTLRTGEGRELGDFELPAQLSCEKLSSLLLAALQSKLPDQFAAVTGLRLLTAGRYLDDSESLADRGVWDGGILAITAKGGVRT